MEQKNKSEPASKPFTPNPSRVPISEAATSPWARVNFTASHESPGHTALYSSWLVPKSRFPVWGSWG